MDKLMELNTIMESTWIMLQQLITGSMSMIILSIIQELKLDQELQVVLGIFTLS